MIQTTPDVSVVALSLVGFVRAYQPITRKKLIEKFTAVCGWKVSKRIVRLARQYVNFRPFQFRAVVGQGRSGYFICDSQEKAKTHFVNMLKHGVACIREARSTQEASEQLFGVSEDFIFWIDELKKEAEKLTSKKQGGL